MKREIVLFTGPNCPSCKVVKDKFKEEIESGKIIVKDVAKLEDAKYASTFSVMSLPTALVLEDGKPVRSCIGTSAVYELPRYLVE